MSLHQLASHMSARGRGPDSTLVHMSPREVEGLQKLAVAHGTSLTINPDTGLPEAFSLKDLLPTLAGAAINYFAPGFGTAIGGALGLSGAAGTGLAVGAATAAISGDLGKGLQAGLGAYGGAGITEGLMGFGTGALSAEAGKVAIPSGMDALGYEAEQLSQNAIASKLASSGKFDTLSAGASKAMSDPMGAVKAIGGGSTGKGLGLAAAALSPLLAGETGNTVQTVTKRPLPRPRQPSVYDNMSQTFERYAANGGLMGLAHGGAVRRFNGKTGSVVNPFDPNANFMASTGPDERMIAYINERFGTNNTATNTAATNTAATNTANTGGGFAATPEAAASVATPTKQIETAPLAAAQVFPTEVAADNTGIAALPQAPVKVAETTPIALNNALTNMGAGKGMSVQEASQKVLGRQLSPTELSNWNSRIGSDDVTAAELSQFSIAAQPERALGINNTNNAIREMYLERLGRYPDASGLAYFSNKFGNTVEDSEREIFKNMTTEEFEANAEQKKKGLPTVVTDLTTADTKYIKEGVGGSAGAGQIGGGTTVNPNGTITTSPRIPGIPVGGFTGMENVRDTYEAGGGNLGYTSPTYTKAEFDKTYTNTGHQKEMYDYLMGKGDKPTKMKNADGTFREIARPYNEAVLGVPSSTNVKRIWNPLKGEYFRNPDYMRQRTIRDPDTKAKSTINYMSINQAKAALAKTPLEGNALAEWSIDNFVDPETLAEATGMNQNQVTKLLADAKADKSYVKKVAGGGLLSLANGGLAGVGYADGGLPEKERTNSVTGVKYYFDFDNGIYRAETTVKDGITYKWNPVTNKYETGTSNASGIAGLLDMSGNGPPAGGENSANPNWDGMTAEQKAAFYDANPTFAAITQAGQKALGILGITNPLEAAIAKGVAGLNAFNASNNVLGIAPAANPMSLDPAQRAQAEATTAQNQRTAQDTEQQSSDSPFGPVDAPTSDISDPTGADAAPADSAANGGMIGRYAQGGLGSLGGYSDGGRLLRGPGDGVSDSIPASIGDRQPARLADGEFVVPARIVSELGNGSTEAGARALYKMMDRIQANRRKTTGKNSVAVDSKAHKYLPA